MIEHYLNRAITLAKMGGKAVGSNPNVGAVIVHNDKIIGEGYHQRFGEAHAEVKAIQDCINNGHQRLLEESTIYVTLEPCNHYGNTPPCCKAILDHKIPNVIVGTLDPTPKLQGKGVAYLENNGTTVSVIHSQEAKQLIRRFTVNHLEQRPYIIIKYAQSKDYFISKAGEQTPLSNPYTNILTHRWRTEVDGILIGSNTLMIDNPRLTARHYPGDNPLRIVLDYNGKLNNSHHLLNDEYPLLVVNGTKTESKGNKTWVSIPRDEAQLSTLVSTLYKRGIYSVLIEGGANTINQFVKAKLWDEARIITCDKVLENGVASPTLSGKLFEKYSIANDQINHFFKTS